jgi:hypothetical protein
MNTKHTALIALAIMLGLGAATAGAQTAVGYYTRYREQAAASVPTPPSSAWQNLYLDSTTHVLMRKDSTGTSTAVSGSSAVFADAPLGGDGSSGSHLTCTLCVTTTGSQTLTNKTLTAPVLGDGLTASGSTAWNFSGSTGTWLFPTGGLAGHMLFATNDTYDIGSGTSTARYVYAEQFRGQNSSNLIIAIAGAGAGIFMRPLSGDASGFVFLQNKFRPDTDGTETIGDDDKRVAYLYLGVTGADPTCGASQRGKTRVFFAAGGASDELRICMKAAADTYAWRTVFTAP